MHQSLSIEFIKIWYLNVLKKQISYGHEVWYNDLKYHGLQRLSSCQRMCLLSLIRSYRTTSTDALCVLAGTPPLHLELSASSLKYNVIHGNSSMEINDILVNSSKLMNKIKSYDYPYFCYSHHINFVRPVVDSVPVYNHPVIFTDGSKMNEGVAAAFTVYYHEAFIFDFRVKLRSFNSVYQAELVAISEAIDWCRSTAFKVFHLYTDSLSSYSALQGLFPTDSLLLKIFTNLRLLNKKVIHIGWVKAHVGIQGNERADYLAKSVIMDGIFDKEEDIPIPISYLNSALTRKIISDWQHHWDNSDKGRDTFRLLRLVNTDYLCYSQICAYFYSSHGAFPTYLYKIGRRDTDRCLCQRRGDVRHYLFDSCQVSDTHFYFHRNRSVEWNICNILNSRSNYGKLKKIYNSLNKAFSFIKYSF